MHLVPLIPGQLQSMIRKGKASVASKGTFETAFLNANEWKAQWIQPAKNSNAKVEIPLHASCRYVKLDVTKLGLPASTDSKFYFLQLAEMEIYSGEENGVTCKSVWIA